MVDQVNQQNQSLRFVFSRSQSSIPDGGAARVGEFIITMTGWPTEGWGLRGTEKCTRNCWKSVEENLKYVEIVGGQKSEGQIVECKMNVSI